MNKNTPHQFNFSASKGCLKIVFESEQKIHILAGAGKLLLTRDDLGDVIDLIHRLNSVMVSQGIYEKAGKP